MRKNIVQDVIPPDKKSIRRLSLSESKERNNYDPIFHTTDNHPHDALPFKGKSELKSQKGMKNATEIKIHRYDEETGPVMPDEDTPSIPPLDEDFERGPRYGLWLLGLIALIVIVMISSSVFAVSTVKVTPKQQKIVLNGTYMAYKDAEPGDLQYEVVKISRDEGKTTVATGEEKVETKASGTIIVYNAHSSSSQRLITNTRFETPDGLIYRISEPINIPGTTVKNGETVPGSVEVTVYADETGKEYNIDPTDFTIPGFKGDARFSSIYARSKTALTGGFSGLTAKISQDDLDKVKKELQDDIKNQLIRDANAQIPDNFILYSDGIIVTFEDLPQTDMSAESVKINLRGTLYGIIFNKEGLNKYLANKEIQNIEKENVEVLDMENLSFNLVEKAQLDLETNTAINFAIKGGTTVVWRFDDAKLRSDLAGISKKSIQSVMESYPAISKAEAVVKPFWLRSLPKNEQKIKVERIINP